MYFIIISILILYIFHLTVYCTRIVSQSLGVQVGGEETQHLSDTAIAIAIAIAMLPHDDK